ncbi:hypothetical protein GCM10009777_20450 [Microbacterium pumilum]|uniref:Excalibur calcium-binding domain-containing protein n=2 Tax=Microbacterium pumilum TaxID=344165 RepID=A0ABN2SGZ9_9MICO
MKRGSRARMIVAIVASTLLVAGGGAALWPRSVAETSAETIDPHTGHLSVIVGGSDAGDATTRDASTVVPPESESAGDTPQASLAAAAGSNPFALDGARSGGTASIQASALATSEAEAPTRNGAAGLGKPRPDVKPGEVIDPDATLGGCNPAYGDDGQCLPVIPPSQSAHAAEMIDAGLDPASMVHTWKCEEVREYFPDGIAVRVPGVDPDTLDADDDGTACEPD